jgi:hypothetical protein
VTLSLKRTNSAGADLISAGVSSDTKSSCNFLVVILWCAAPE